MKGRGTFWFWCGSRRRCRPRSFLSAHCLLNQWVDFNQTCTDRYGEKRKKWLDFDDIGLIFKVTPAPWIINFWQKSFSAPYLLNQMTYSSQTSYIITVGWFKDLIRFWWPWPYFQGNTNTLNVTFGKKACLHPISWTKSNFTYCIIGVIKWIG